MVPMALTQEILEWLVPQPETLQSPSFSMNTQRLEIEKEGRHLVAKASGCKNSLSMLTKPSIFLPLPACISDVLRYCCCIDTSPCGNELIS